MDNKGPSFEQFGMPTRTRNIVNGDHIDHGLRLFLESHYAAARNISNLADKLTCYRQQGLYLALCANNLAASLRKWVENPRTAGKYDDFVEAVQIDMELRQVKDLLVEISRLEPDLSDWETWSLKITETWHLVTSPRYHTGNAEEDPKKFEAARNADQESLISLHRAQSARSPTLDETARRGSVDPPNSANSYISRWSDSSSDDGIDSRRFSQTMTISSSTQKRTPAQARANLLLKRMTDSSGVDARWVGVGSMERLRALTPGQVRLQALIDKLVERERKFITCIDVARIIPSFKYTGRTSAPTVDLTDILYRLFKEHQLVLQAHRRFLHELLDRRTSLDDARSVAVILIQHAPGLVEVYDRLARSLPSSFDVLQKEVNVTPEFAQALIDFARRSQQKDTESSLAEVLLEPLKHIEFYPAILRGLKKEADNLSDAVSILTDASNAFIAMAMEARLLAWQNDNSGRHPEFEITWDTLASQAEWLDYSNVSAVRQIGIFNFIKEQMRYVQSLEDFRVIYLDRLQEPRSFPIPDSERYDKFVRLLANSNNKFIGIHQQLLKKLHAIQLSELPIVNDFCHASGLDQIPWSRRYEGYLKALNGFIMYSEEMMYLSGFRDFIKSCSVSHGSKQKGFIDYLREPLVHIERSTSLLRDILDATPAEHPESDSLSGIVKVFGSLKELTQTEQHESESKTIEHYADQVRYSEALLKEEVQLSALELSSPQRKLIKDGPVLLVPERGSDERKFQKLILIVLDNYVLLTVSNSNRGLDRYDLVQRPIPMELLDIALIDKGASPRPIYSPGQVGPSIASTLTLGRRDRNGATTLLIESSEELQVWRRKIKEAAMLWFDGRRKLYTLTTAHPSIRGASHAFPFLYNSHKFYVYAFRGEKGGIWVIPYNDPTKPKQRISSTSVDDVAVINDNILVQSNRTLIAYTAQSLIDSKPVKPWEIECSREVVFFRVHRARGQVILAIAVFHQGVHELHVYDGNSLKLGSTFQRKKVAIKKLTEKECNFQEPLRDVLFGSQIGVTTKGFRFLTDKPKNPASPGGLRGRESVILPQSNDTQIKLLKRCEASRPLSMHTVGKQHILCYDEFAVYVNGESGKMTGRYVDWECRPALHVIWRPPNHVILVSAKCLEVRDMATGALLQLIVGHNGQELVCDGRGVQDDLESLGLLFTTPNQEGRKTLSILSRVA